MFSRYIILVLAIASTSALTYDEEECLNYIVYPVQYDLNISPYIHKNTNSYYDCILFITVIANAPNVRVIELDSARFDIDSVDVYEESNRRSIINKYRPYEYKNVTNKLQIYLQEPLKEFKLYKTKYVIKIMFRSDLKSYGTGSGIMLVPYEEGTSKSLIITRLSPKKAKDFFPCFDDPRFEAVFKFRVHFFYPNIGVQPFNTSLVISQLEIPPQYQENNYTLLTYTPSPQVALHQVGFHYSDFGSRQVSSRITGDTIVLWAPPRRLIHYDYILQFGESILNKITEYTSFNRPLTNGPINLVAVPTNVDGYEVGSWNLLTNGEPRMAYISQLTSIKQLERMRFELAQQLCRIWLGNPGEVKRTRWQEEWFKEGMATYVAHYLLAQLSHIQSSGNRWPLGIYGLQMKNIAMAEDWHHSTPSLSVFNRTLAVEIPSRYKNLVTMKTASLLWMVENWMGSDKFHAALVKYINMMRGGYISLDSFMLNLDVNTVECQHQFFNGSTASKILNSWFRQSGYPVINVNVLRDRTPNAVQLKQHKFSFTKDNRADSHYHIPISYIVQNNQNCYNCYQPRFTIDQTYTFEENLNNGWIILNRNASGYYRVNYDTETWKLIAKTLNNEKSSIDEQNRAQIVNDVFALYVSGDMDQSLAYEILYYLSKETSPAVWESVISGFELLQTENAACPMTRHLYSEWQKFMADLVKPVYDTVTDSVEQFKIDRLFRSNIINFACAVRVRDCVENLDAMQKQYMYRKQRIEPDSREACYFLRLQNKGGFEGHGFNTFDIEDKITAEHRMAKENKFLYRIPAGSPAMGQLIMSTTLEPITAAITEKIPVIDASMRGGAPYSNIASVITMGIAAFVIAAIR